MSYSPNGGSSAQPTAWWFRAGVMPTKCNKVT
jgi:hypothetical protein